MSCIKLFVICLAIYGAHCSDSYKYEKLFNTTKYHGDEGLKNHQKLVKFEHQLMPNFDNQYLQQYGSIEQMEIHFCGIQSIEKHSFAQLEGLKKLVINNNPLELIRIDTLNVSSVEELDLSDNMITEIEYEAFGYMASLKIFKIARNKIWDLNPSWFTKTPNLVSIDFSSNKIETIPEYFFSNMAQAEGSVLESVIFKDNEISHIENGAFDGLKIKKLDLSHNKLNYVSSSIFNAESSVGLLDLSQNEIWRMYGDFSAAQECNVMHNKWQCDSYLDFKKKYNGNLFIESQNCGATAFRNKFIRFG